MPFLSDLRYVPLFLIATPIEPTASNTTLEGPVSGLDMIGYASIPTGSGAATGPFSDELKAGIDHPAGVWFDELVRELSFRATNLNVVYTLLHFKNSDRAIWHAEPTIEDSYDRFQRTHHAFRLAARRQEGSSCPMLFGLTGHISNV
jgi:hypothetical protein